MFFLVIRKLDNPVAILRAFTTYIYDLGLRWSNILFYIIFIRHYEKWTPFLFQWLNLSFLSAMSWFVFLSKTIYLLFHFINIKYYKKITLSKKSTHFCIDLKGIFLCPHLIFQFVNIKHDETLAARYALTRRLI